MNVILPTKIFLTRGSGQHKEKLVSYEMALREAGINPFNLVRVSSIFPPGCELVSREEGLKLLKPGQIVFLVMSENATDEAHRLISASIGMAVPEDERVLRVPRRTRQLRAGRGGRRAVHGGPGGRDAGDEARPEARRPSESGKRHLSPFGDDVRDGPEHHPDGNGKPRAVDDDHRGRRPGHLTYRSRGFGFRILM